MAAELKPTGTPSDVSADTLVALRDVAKYFKIMAVVFSRHVGDVKAVDGVSFDIKEGETLGLVGESGSGKTTVGRCILRLIEPTRGHIYFEGGTVDITTLKRPAMRALRREMQIIFQDPFASLNPRIKVLEIVSEPLAIHEAGKRSKAQMADAATEMMKAVGLDESALRRYPHEFSGGQRQRIGIARALILRPKLIVADEPVSALDVSVGAQVLLLLRELQAELGLTYVFISHSLPVVAQLASRIAVMQRGRFVEVGEAEQVLHRPTHEYTRELLSAMPLLPAG